MDVVTIRELSRSPAQVLARLRSGPLLVTQGGRPVAALHGLDVGDLEDFVLANAPEFVRSMREADEALAEGRVRPAAEILAELPGKRGAGPKGRTAATRSAATVRRRAAAKPRTK
jgi:antitoxin (DNA-binding transcriptional repressor) of toxin-antitoxin stability system